MRRRSELAKKLRVKILEDRRNGLTYEEIQRKRGVSSRTVANLVKGKDPKRFCQICGETNPEKLEEHHPDRTNYPNQTVTLCASCHAKVTREEQKKRNREKQNRVLTPKVTLTQQVPSVQSVPFPRSPVPTSPTRPLMKETQTPPPRPLTSDEWRFLGKVGCYTAAGTSLGEGLCNKKLPWWARLILVGITGVPIWIASKLGRPVEKQGASSEVPKPTF